MISMRPGKSIKNTYFPTVVLLPLGDKVAMTQTLSIPIWGLNLAPAKAVNGSLSSRVSLDSHEKTGMFFFYPIGKFYNSFLQLRRALQSVKELILYSGD